MCVRVSDPYTCKQITEWTVDVYPKYVYMGNYTPACLCICSMYICTYTHIYIHIYLHVYTYVYMVHF